VLNKVNRVISNIEKEENMEKERSEFINFLTSSIFANALKILVEEGWDNINDNKHYYINL